jgi:MoxR-like ATPase
VPVQYGRQHGKRIVRRQKMLDYAIIKTSFDELIAFLDDHKYVADDEMVTALFLLLKLHKPLLLEGPPAWVKPK